MTGQQVRRNAPTSDGAGGDLEVVPAAVDVATAVARIEGALRRRGITLFATVDHGANARAVGAELPDEVLLLLGDPAVGTVLMQDDPRVGLDLPLRLLVWAAPGGTRIAFRRPASLARDFALEDRDGVLARMHGLLEALAAEAGS